MTAMRKPVPVTRDAKQEQSETAPVPVAQGWEPFASLRREFDRLFDEMTSAWPPSRPFEARPWTRLGAPPAADIVENDGEYVVTMDIPGMDEKDIEVKLSDGVVTIRGEKTEETKEEKADYRLSERRRGSFVRSFTMPASVEPDKIVASYQKGVLTVRMPKTEAAKQKQRRIEVTSA